jgi:hypothetical protein
MFGRSEDEAALRVNILLSFTEVTRGRNLEEERGWEGEQNGVYPNTTWCQC